MGSPSGVRDGSMGVKGLGEVWLGGIDQLLQPSNFSNLLEGQHFIFLITVDGKTCRVVSSIFKPGQT